VTGGQRVSASDRVSAAHTIFDQPWWLDAVAPGAWSEIVIENDGRPAARLPYVFRRRRGLRIVTQPALTQTLGPWVASSEARYARRLGTEKHSMNELLDRLPPFDLFLQNFSPAVTNWLPFYWAGFSGTTRYTYRIEDLTDLDAVWSGFLPNIRTDIRKSSRQVEVRSGLPVEGLWPLIAETFTRQGAAPPYCPALLQRLDAACTGRDAGRAFFAVDAHERTHAAIYVVWDTRTAYYLIGARKDEFAHAGATSLLLWEAIKFASAVTRVFDFEGSMIEPVERFFRAFGAQQVPYFQVWKARRRVMPLLRLGGHGYLPDSTLTRR
jgi:hypothetical protein